MLNWPDAVGRCPLIAILRGITPEESTSIGQVLVDAGFTIIEVPLNSPEPLESIGRLSQALGSRALIGAGTVIDPSDVNRVADAGGRLVVSPHTDPRVVEASRARGLASLPGIATASEAFAALAAGASGLKLFPAEGAPPRVLKALRAVLPAEVPLFPVGSIAPETMRGYWDAGASGFGLGSALYRPGATTQQVGEWARAFIAALRQLPGQS